VTYHRFGDRPFRYDYRNGHSWLDTYHLGVIEGVAMAFGTRTMLTVHLVDTYRGSIDVRWY
jgi:hypothetical protein